MPVAEAWRARRTEGRSAGRSFLPRIRRHAWPGAGPPSEFSSNERFRRRTSVRWRGPIPHRPPRSARWRTSSGAWRATAPKPGRSRTPRRPTRASDRVAHRTCEPVRPGRWPRPSTLPCVAASIDDSPGAKLSTIISTVAPLASLSPAAPARSCRTRPRPLAARRHRRCAGEPAACAKSSCNSAHRRRVGHFASRRRVEIQIGARLSTSPAAPAGSRRGHSGRPSPAPKPPGRTGHPGFYALEQLRASGPRARARWRACRPAPCRRGGRRCRAWRSATASSRRGSSGRAPASRRAPQRAAAGPIPARR